MVFNYNRIFVFVLLLSTGFLTACNKQLDLESTHFVKEESQWKTTSDARSGLMGIYALTRAALADDYTHWIMGELRFGDFTPYIKSEFRAVTEDNLTASYPLLTRITNWRRFYAIINSASVFIEKAPAILESDKTYTSSNLRLDLAQARALRAFAYFYMVRIWGDVPLIRSAYDNGQFPEFQQATSKQVLDYAEQELLGAVADLPFVYGKEPNYYYTKQSAYWQGALFNKLSGYALLAHVAAWKSEYMKVEAYTNYLMLNYDHEDLKITYSTTAALSSASSGSIFYGNKVNQIIAFPFQDVYNESTTSGHIEQLTLASPFTSNTYPQLYVSKDTIASVFNELDNRDQRFGIDTISGLYRTPYFTNFSASIPVFSKIKIQVNTTGDYKLPLFGSTIVFTRLEEIALLRAEALAVLNRNDEAVALLNILRANRNLAPFLLSSGRNIQLAIFDERRRELMGEGWRWYDQIRLNKILTVNPEIENLIQNNGIYWPISSDVINNNRMIKQNSYWK